MNENAFKENRYDLIKKSLQNRILKLKQDLACDLKCEIEKIPIAEWEECLITHLKRPLDDFWGNEDVAYYLFDKLITEEAELPFCPPDNVKSCLHMWQIE